MVKKSTMHEIQISSFTLYCWAHFQANTSLWSGLGEGVLATSPGNFPFLGLASGSTAVSILISFLINTFVLLLLRFLGV